MKNNQPPRKPDLRENYSSKLAVIAGAIATLGDGLATIAAALALQEEENSNSNSHKIAATTQNN